MLKEKVLPSMALSENVSHLVYTADNDLISISALNTDDSEVTEPMLLHGVSKLKVFNRRSPLNKLSAEHDVVGMVAKTDATFRRTHKESNQFQWTLM